MDCRPLACLLPLAEAPPAEANHLVEQDREVRPEVIREEEQRGKCLVPPGQNQWPMGVEAGRNPEVEGSDHPEVEDLPGQARPEMVHHPPGSEGCLRASENR
jgi:hypothetical protein